MWLLGILLGGSFLQQISQAVFVISEDYAPQINQSSFHSIWLPAINIKLHNNLEKNESFDENRNTQNTNSIKEIRVYVPYWSPLTNPFRKYASSVHTSVSKDFIDSPVETDRISKQDANGQKVNDSLPVITNSVFHSLLKRTIRSSGNENSNKRYSAPNSGNFRRPQFSSRLNKENYAVRREDNGGDENLSQYIKTNLQPQFKIISPSDDNTKEASNNNQISSKIIFSGPSSKNRATNVPIGKTVYRVKETSRVYEVEKPQRIQNDGWLGIKTEGQSPKTTVSQKAESTNKPLFKSLTSTQDDSSLRTTLSQRRFESQKVLPEILYGKPARKRIVTSDNWFKDSSRDAAEESETRSGDQFEEYYSGEESSRNNHSQEDPISAIYKRLESNGYSPVSLSSSNGRNIIQFATDKDIFVLQRLPKTDSLQSTRAEEQKEERDSPSQITVLRRLRKPNRAVIESDQHFRAGSRIPVLPKERKIYIIQEGEDEEVSPRNVQQTVPIHRIPTRISPSNVAYVIDGSRSQNRVIVPQPVKQESSPTEIRYVPGRPVLSVDEIRHRNGELYQTYLDHSESEFETFTGDLNLYDSHDGYPYSEFYGTAEEPETAAQNSVNVSGLLSMLSGSGVDVGSLVSMFTSGGGDLSGLISMLSSSGDLSSIISSLTGGGNSSSSGGGGSSSAGGGGGSSSAGGGGGSSSGGGGSSSGGGGGSGGSSGGKAAQGGGSSGGSSGGGGSASGGGGSSSGSGGGGSSGGSSSGGSSSGGGLDLSSISNLLGGANMGQLMNLLMQVTSGMGGGNLANIVSQLTGGGGMSGGGMSGGGMSGGGMSGGGMSGGGMSGGGMSGGGMSGGGMSGGGMSGGGMSGGGMSGGGMGGGNLASLISQVTGGMNSGQLQSIISQFTGSSGGSSGGGAGTSGNTKNAMMMRLLMMMATTPGPWWPWTSPMMGGD